MTAATVDSSPAEAAPGDPVILGQDNDAGTSTTTLYGGLGLAHPAGAPLRLAPGPLPVTADLGAISVDDSGNFNYIADYGDATAGVQPGVATLQSSRWGTMAVPVKPLRLLDTRVGAGRAAIVSGVDNIDGHGRLMSGTSIVVSLDAYVDLGSALHGNLTVAQTLAPGFVTVWGTGSRPTASALNWWGPGQILSNGIFCALGSFGASQTVLAIYAHTAAAVILDVTAFDVGGPWHVHPDALPDPSRYAAIAGIRTMTRLGDRALVV